MLPALVVLVAGFAIGLRRRRLVVVALVPAALFALTVDGDAVVAFLVTYVIALFLLICGALLRRLYEQTRTAGQAQRDL